MDKKSGNNIPMSDHPCGLVVEDDVDDSDLLVRQLQKLDFAGFVRVIPDGREAWNFLGADNSPSGLIALFLDLRLHSVSGLELLRKIKSRSTLDDIPVFVMTSANHPKDLEECSHLGVNGYVNKPVTYLTFAMSVASLFHEPSVNRS